MHGWTAELGLALMRSSLFLAMAALTVRALIWLARPASARVQQILWLAVMLQGVLLVGFPVSIPWREAGHVDNVRAPVDDLAALEQTSGPIVAVPASDPQGEIDNLPATSSSTMHRSTVAKSSIRSPRSLPIARGAAWWRLAVMIYVAGLIVLPAGSLFRYARLLRRAAISQPASEDWVSPWKKLLVQHGVRRTIPLRVTDNIGPALCLLPGGSAVLIPGKVWRSLSPDQRLAILRHELAHHRRGDLYKTLLVRSLALVHWFNPLAWWAACKHQECVEWVCDESAAGEEHAASMTYVEALMRLGGANLMPGSYGTAARGGRLFGRVRRLLSDQPREDKKMKMFALLTIALGLVIVGLLRLELVAKQPDEAAATAIQGSQRTAAITAEAAGHAESQAEGATTAVKQKAVEAIKRLGGKVEFDEQKPDKPVVKVQLNGTLVTDDDLAILAELTDLRELNLRDTRIGDFGLKHLKELQNLQELILAATYVENDGLESLTELTNLTTLNLANSKITAAGLARVKNLRHLKELDLSNSFITDERLAHLSDLKLKVLRLGRNDRITSAGLAHLENMTDLQILGLNNTAINDSGLAHLHGLNKLQELDLTGTQVTDEGLAHLAHLVNLRSLSLAWSDSRITDTGVAHLGGLTKLETLSLWESRISDMGLRHLKRMTNLNSLLLGRTKITDEGLMHLKGFTNLRTLKLNFCPVTDAGLAHLKDLRLEWLSLRHCTQVTEAGLAHLKGMTSLTGLELPSTKLSDACLEHLKGLTKLENLLLTGSQFTDAGFVHLKGFTNLRLLFLGDHVTGAGLEHLGDCTNLERLSAGSNFTDVGLEHAKAWPHLKRLDLYSQHITDEGLQHLKGLTNLEILRMGSAPEITSAGMKSLQGLTKLTQLFISRTQVDDVGLAHLKALKNLQLLVIGSPITNAGLEHLQAFPNLRTLNLEGSSFTDECVVHLRNIPQLEGVVFIRTNGISCEGLSRNLKGMDYFRWIRFADCDVDDADVYALKELTRLNFLAFGGTQVTDAGVKRLQEAMPNTTVRRY